jgi:hypothetical protein
MVLSVGGSFAYFAQNAPCTVTTDLLVLYSNTQNFYPGGAIFSLHTLASPSDRNVNYDEKQLTGGKIELFFFYLYRFRKYVSYGFPIINVCNPRSTLWIALYFCELSAQVVVVLVELSSLFPPFVLFVFILCCFFSVFLIFVRCFSLVGKVLKLGNLVGELWVDVKDTSTRTQMHNLSVT